LPKRGAKPIDRPFARKILAQARETAAAYQIVVQYEDGEWFGRGLEMPNVFGDGPTAEACVENTREALTAAVAYLLETKQRVPAAAAVGRRNEQVNVRLTAEEKLLLEASAKKKGFSGLSDFIRAAAVEATTR
jgi:predicted RNase H-like HicB family nuclease